MVQSQTKLIVCRPLHKHEYWTATTQLFYNIGLSKLCFVETVLIEGQVFAAVTSTSVMVKSAPYLFTFYLEPK